MINLLVWIFSFMLSLLWNARNGYIVTAIIVRSLSYVRLESTAFCTNSYRLIAINYISWMSSVNWEINLKHQQSRVKLTKTVFLLSQITVEVLSKNGNRFSQSLPIFMTTYSAVLMLACFKTQVNGGEKQRVNSQVMTSFTSRTPAYHRP